MAKCIKEQPTNSSAPPPSNEDGRVQVGILPPSPVLPNTLQELNTQDFYSFEFDIPVPNIISTKDIEIVVATPVPVEGLDDSSVEQAINLAKLKGLSILFQYFGRNDLQFQDPVTIEQFSRGYFTYLDHYADPQLNFVAVYLTSIDAQARLEELPVILQPLPPISTIDVVLQYRCDEDDFQKQFTRAADVMREYDRIIRRSEYSGTVNNINLVYDAGSLEFAGDMILQFLQTQDNFDPSSSYDIRLRFEPQTLDLIAVEGIGNRPILNTPITANQLLLERAIRNGIESIQGKSAEELRESIRADVEQTIADLKENTQPFVDFLSSLDEITVEEIIEVNQAAQDIWKNIQRSFSTGVSKLNDLLSPRDKFYLRNLYQIASTDIAFITWTRFLFLYAPFPKPEILPSQGFGGAFDPNSFRDVFLDQATRKYGGDINRTANCFRDQYTNFQEVGRSLRRSINSVKTIDEVIDEKVTLAGSELERQIIEQANATVQQTVDSQVLEIEETIAKINTLDQVFLGVLNKISLGSLADALVDCLPIIDISCQTLKLPKVPTVGFPDILPTVDIMGDLSTNITNALIDALTEVFVVTVGSMIQSLLSICDPGLDLNLGERETENINDAISDSDRPSTPGRATGSRGDDMKIAALDFVCNITNTTPSEELQPYCDEMTGLLEDVSLLISARDVCRMFAGKASQKNLGIVLMVVKEKYPLLKTCLTSKPVIASFFTQLGQIVDSSFCEALSQLPTLNEISIEGECEGEEPIEDEFSQLTQLYESRNVSPETLQDLLLRAKKRKQDRLQQIRKIAQIISDNENGGSSFADMVNQANGDQPFFNYDHESYDFMQDSLLDTLFGPLRSFFDRDIDGIIESMISNRDVDVEVPKFIEIKNEEGDVTEIVSPQMKRLEAEGVDIDPILEKSGDTVNVKESRLEAAPSVKNTLSRIENSDVFLPFFNDTGVYYELNVPIDPEVLAGVGEFFDTYSSISNMVQVEGDSGPPDISLQMFGDALPNWKIRYILPYSMASKQISQNIKDEYILEIFSGDSVENSNESLRKVVEDELNEKSEAYILEQIVDQNSPLSVELVAANQTRDVFLPDPQSVFGRFVSDRWYKAIINSLDEDNLASYEVASLKKFNVEMSKFFAASVHGQVVKDLFALIARQVANSTLFESKFSSVGLGQVVQTSSVPNLSTLNFNEIPTPLETACGIMPHPLKIDCFKKELEQNIQNNLSTILSPEANSEAEGMDPWDEQVIQIVVKMTVRAYAYDYAMRVIYLIPDFTIEESVDGYLIEFLVKKMREELRLYGPQGIVSQYQRDFGYWAHVVYSREVGEEPKERTDVTEEDAEVALRYLLSKSFASVCVDVRNGIEKTLPETISSHKTPKEYFIEDWVPTISLPTSVDPWSSRFTTLDGGLLTNVGDGLVELNGRQFNLENGNFFLEKYIKVVRKDFVDIEETLKENVPASANPDIDALVQIVRNSWIQNFTDRPGEKINYMNINNFAEAFEKFKSDVETQAQNGLSKVSSDFWNICNFFEEVTPGMRLIYLLPTKTGSALSAGFTVQNIDSKFGTNVPSYEEYYGGQTYFSEAINTLNQTGVTVGQGEDKINNALTTLRFREKAYSILEERCPEADPTQLIQEPSAGVVREIYPIPFIDTATCIGDSQWWEENRTKSIFEFSPTPQNAKLWWSTEYFKNEEMLRSEIANSQEYSVLFDYIFPLDRYLSIITTYTFMSVSSIPNVESAFGSTKDQLYSLFNIISESLNTLNAPSEGYKFKQFPSNEEISNFFSKAKFEFQSPCFSFAFSPVPPNLRGFGVDIFLKLALKTPLLIFKGFVEIADPNIKQAKFIVDLLKAIGICVPLPFVSFALLPPTVFGFPPFGIGIGPPLTPYGFGYLALGFESFFSDLFDGDNDPETPELPPVDPEACEQICPDKTY